MFLRGIGLVSDLPIPAAARDLGAALAVDPDALLSEIEASQLLGISWRTLQTWRLEDRGPPIVRLGTKLIKYRRRDLAAWMAANTERPILGEPTP